MSGSSFQLELSCPQCGGPVELEETDHLFGCPFCRVRLYVHCTSTCRFYLPPQQAREEDTVLYVPYWRFKGVGYALSGLEVRHKIIDTTVAALDREMFPMSLGLRPQALKIKFLVPSVQGLFLRPDHGRRDLLTRLGDMYLGLRSSGRDRAVQQAYVGEAFSVIYAPFMVRGEGLHDGITGRRIGRMSGADSLPPPKERGGEAPMSFVPAMCVNCGWDLTGDPKSLVLTCRHCDRLWEVRGTRLKELTPLFFGDDPDVDLWLPFWKMRVEGDDLELQTNADFMELARMPRALPQGCAERPFAVWTPAFKIRPKIYLRLSRQMTLAMLDKDADEHLRFPREEFYPVTLPAEEAVQSVPITLGAMVPAKRKVFPELEGKNFKLEERSLVYVPFKARGPEMIQPDMGFAVHCSNLRWGKGL